MVLKINGDIVGNGWKEAYSWFGFDCTTPADVEAAVRSLPEGEPLQVKINSFGGEVPAGQEIYSMLRGVAGLHIEVESVAASAASVVAMAGESAISPVGIVMIHDVSGTASGNKRDFRRMADVLRTHDEALAEAYAAKTGRDASEFVALMDRETWLTARQAVGLGLIDRISDGAGAPTNALGGMRVTEAMAEECRAAMRREREAEAAKAALLSDLYKYGV